MAAKVTRWQGPDAPTEPSIRRIYDSEGLNPYGWSNGPGHVYGAHSHSYSKVIYVVQGSITFGLPESGEEVALNAGDRLDLPRGVQHDAVVGAQGVVCLEAHH
jgi:hypothetical protein